MRTAPLTSYVFASFQVKHVRGTSFLALEEAIDLRTGGHGLTQVFFLQERI